MTKGERIASLRKLKGMTMVEMADKIGVLKQTLYKYENDVTTNIPSDKIELIADALGCSPSFIMGWDEKPKKIDRQEKASKIEHLFSLLSDDQQKLVTDLIENLLATRKQ